MRRLIFTVIHKHFKLLTSPNSENGHNTVIYDINWIRQKEKVDGTFDNPDSGRTLSWFFRKQGT